LGFTDNIEIGKMGNMEMRVATATLQRICNPLVKDYQRIANPLEREKMRTEKWE